MSMKIAYITLAHKLPEQLVRLVRKLNTDAASFFIHIDKKTDGETYRKMTEPLRAYENVYFLKRHMCSWRDFGVVEATLEGIRKVLALRLRYDYVILLTGQDYPIKSNRHIQEVLQKSGGRSFRILPLPSERWSDGSGGLDRVTYWHFSYRGRRIPFLKRKQLLPSRLSSLWLAFAKVLRIHRKVPENVRLFGGSAYWCLTRDCIEYVDEFAQRNAGFVKFFKHAFAPDEIFFQTVLMNSPLKNSLVDNNLRHIVWNDTPHPKILCKQDAEEIIGTDKLFARKFDMTIDADVLDMIDWMKPL